jgi:hypothetical protein
MRGNMHTEAKLAVHPSDTATVYDVAKDTLL